MATAKKSRPKKKVAPSESEPVATKVNGPEVEATSSVEGPAPEPTVERAKPARRRSFEIHLRGSSSFNSRGYRFTAARPLVTSDERIYEAVKDNSRFRVVVREGGAQ